MDFINSNESIADRISRNLTKGEMLRVLELIDWSMRVGNAEELRTLESLLKELFEFEFLSCGLGALTADCDLRIGFILNCSYPEEYFSYYVDSELIKHDPVVMLGLEVPRLYYLADILKIKKEMAIKEGFDLTRSYGIKEGYSTGFRNAGRGLTSIFSFAGNSLPRSERSELILDLLGPHLHAALCRAASLDGYKVASPLSPRETEVLQWIKSGKSSWDISLILSLSEATVKFHVGNILKKLDARTRSQALAEAIQRGYISLG